MAISEIEFEQKYLLDDRKATAIVDKILTRPDVKKISIRQFYTKDGLRYRHIITLDGEECKIEPKKSIKLGTSFSINIEEQPTIVSYKQFQDKWDHSKRRLTKTRFEFSGTPIGHKIMVDFFFKKHETYAVVAEVETMINSETKTLFLELALPEYLEPFLLKKIDDRDASSKNFKSANMTDTNIEILKKAISELYGRA